jgi:hypothetical protein
MWIDAGDASTALEMKEIEGALKATQSHTLNHLLTQALAQRNQVLALGGRGGEEWMLFGVFVLWLVSSKWGGEGGYKYPIPKTSRYCTKHGLYQYYWPQVGTTDGCLEMKQWGFIGSTGLGLKLPRFWKNSASEPVSVLPTDPGIFRKESKCARVGLVSLTLRSSL